MNKYIKKICSGVIISVMAGSLTACGSSNQSAAKKTADGKIQVEYWYGLGGKLDENMQKIINDFNESQDKYEVKGVAQEDYDATYKSLQAAIAAKKCPSIALLEADKQYTLGSKDLLTDLSEYTNKDSEYNESNYLEALIECGKQNDKLYGFPIFGTTQLLYYNKQVFKDAGIKEEDLKTWTGLSEAARKLVKKDGENISFAGWDPMWGPDNLVDAALSNGGKILSDDG